MYKNPNKGQYALDYLLLILFFKSSFYYSLSPNSLYVMPYFVIRLRRRAQGLATYLYSKPMANYYVSERRDTIRLFWLLLRAASRTGQLIQLWVASGTTYWYRTESYRVDSSPHYTLLADLTSALTWTSDSVITNPYFFLYLTPFQQAIHLFPFPDRNRCFILVGNTLTILWGLFSWFESYMRWNWNWNTRFNRVLSRTLYSSKKIPLLGLSSVFTNKYTRVL